MPELDEFKLDECCQDKGQQHHAGLGEDQQPAPVQPVSDHAGPRAKQQHGQRAQHGNDAEGGFGVGQFPDHPGLGGDLQPGADQADSLPGNINTEVGQFQR